jgi:hypothetical protein
MVSYLDCAENVQLLIFIRGLKQATLLGSK